MKSQTETVVHVEATGDVLRDAFDIHGRLQRNPYGMVAGALGMGFVLGGGLFTRLAAHVVGIGLRLGLMTALPILEKQIAQAFNGAKSDTNVRHKNGD
jgi:hypothetical protein